MNVNEGDFQKKLDSKLIEEYLAETRGYDAETISRQDVINLMEVVRKSMQAEIDERDAIIRKGREENQFLRDRIRNLTEEKNGAPF